MTAVHWIEPFLIEYSIPAGASLDEAARITLRYQQLQRATSNWLKTGKEGDVIEAILFEFGIEPNSYWGEICKAIDQLTDDQTEIESLSQLNGYVLDLEPSKSKQLVFGAPGSLLCL
jgi:hypothetical protein